MEKLTNNDIDVLLKSLDAYKSQASHNGLMSVMLMAALSKKDENDPDKFKREADQTMEEATSKSEQLEEVVILLKAKLILMRDRSIIEEASTFLITG
jgi:hypothetical protein